MDPPPRFSRPRPELRFPLPPHHSGHRGWYCSCALRGAAVAGCSTSTVRAVHALHILARPRPRRSIPTMATHARDSTGDRPATISFPFSRSNGGWGLVAAYTERSAVPVQVELGSPIVSHAAAVSRRCLFIRRRKNQRRSMGSWWLCKRRQLSGHRMNLSDGDRKDAAWKPQQSNALSF
jgi:hypothetical protein